MIIQDRLLSVHGSNLSFSHIEEELKIFCIYLEETKYDKVTFLPQRNLIYRNQNEKLNSASTPSAYRKDGIVIGTVFGTMRGIGEGVHTKQDTDKDYEDVIQILEQVEKILVQTVDRYESLIFLFKSYVIKNRFE